MNSKIRIASAILSVASLWVAVLPISSAVVTPRSSEAGTKGVKDVKLKKGPEVAAKVRKLRENQENVRAALRYFDRKGKPAKIDDSFAITGLVDTPTAQNGPAGVRVMPASFTQEISGPNVELIFIPVYTTSAEWQGTVIANRYDDYGSLVEQYIAESVLVAPDSTVVSWDEIYEAPVYGGALQSPIDEPGMYVDYSWGSPVDQQSPENLLRISKTRTAQAAKIVKAGLQTRRARVRAWARCSFAWCAGAGVFCVAAGLFFAEVIAMPCFITGCGASMIGCTWGTIWQ